MKADNHDTADDRSIAENGCAVIESMLESALALQEQIQGMAIWRIDFFLPAAEGPVEERVPSENEKASDSIVDNSVNIGPVNVYSMSESLNETLSDFIGQTFSVASAYSQYAAPVPDAIKDPHLLKGSLSKDFRERYETVHGPDHRSIKESKTSSTVIEGLMSAMESVSDVRLDESSAVMTESFHKAIKSGSEKALDVLSSGQIDRHTIDVPAISPRRKSLAVTGEVMDSPYIRSGEKEATVEKGSSVKHGTTEESYSSVLSSIYDALAEYSSASFAANVIEPMLIAGGQHASLSTGVSELYLLSTTGAPGRQQPAQDSMSPLSILLEAGVASAGTGISQAVYEIHDHGQAFNAITGGMSMTKEVAGLQDSRIINSGTSLASIYRSIENVRNASNGGGARVESQRSPGTSFNNTFNITVNMKGREDEAEMRELGKKIGLILTEELKRYGGSG